jgi:hypothetical protein
VVEIEKSQDGVDYHLVDNRNVDLNLSDELDGTHTVGGTGANILLRSVPLSEDTTIRILATKNFKLENLQTERKTLDVILPIVVRANPALDVSVEPSPILNYKDGAARIRIHGSQSSVWYRAHARRLVDEDYRVGGAVDGTVIRVPVEGKPDVVVAVPPPAPAYRWVAPPDFTEASGYIRGNGAALDIPLDPAGLTDDAIVIIEAQKRQADENTEVSAVRLNQALAILVRPDPNAPLHLKAESADGKTTTGTLLISGGQPRVFYHLSLDGNEIGRPVYFHEPDRGVGRLALEVDFVVAGAGGGVGPASPALDTPALPVDAVLSIRAVKALTGVAVDLPPRRLDR